VKTEEMEKGYSKIENILKIFFVGVGANAIPMLST
jgi:hypothetical protein